MKTAMTAGFVLLMAVLCLAQTSKPTEQTLTADDVLRAYARRVHADVLPRVKELKDDEILQLVTTIVEQVLGPHKDLLFERSKTELAELPKLTADFNSGWETVANIDSSVIEAERSRPTSHLTTEPVKNNALMLLSLWNAKAAAYTTRTHAIIRLCGAREYGQRAIIEALARPFLYAVDPDPRHPIIAIETGPEIFVISLKHTDEGYYVDDKVQWLRKKGAASQPVGASAVNPKQKLAAAYFEALTTADVKKANEMVDVPYSMDRKTVLTTREEVEDMHQQIADRKGKRDIPQYTIELTNHAPELDKARFPKYVVYRIAVTLVKPVTTQSTATTREHKEHVDLYVVDSDTPKIVGFSD
jgi:hypothetical protein